MEAPGPLDALAQAQWPAFRGVAPAIAVYSDVDLGGGRTERRNDVPIDRRAWHFGARDVHVLRPAADPGARL